MKILRALSAIALLALVHFVIAMLIGVLAFGTDFDQLRSRSAVSRAAGVVHDVLWFPHDTALHAMPNVWLIRYPAIIPLAIVANSLVWGTVLYVVMRWSGGRSSRRSDD